MNFQTAIASLGRPKTFGEAIAAIRAEHGKRASKFLAEQLGVTMRTAQRYLKGEFQPRTNTAAGRTRREGVMRAASRRWVAAALLRNATRVNVGRVRVWDKSKDRPAGTRFVGMHTVGGTLLAEDLVAVADLLQDGREDEALFAFSDAMLDAYSRDKGDPPGTASGPLYIYDYLTGIQVETT